jgi:uncharacterized membrane protein
MQRAIITEVPFRADADFGAIEKSRGRSIHKVPASFSAAYFSAALVTDLVYWHIPNVMWERFSIWLIVAGLMLAGIAAIGYVIDLAGGRQTEKPAWPRVVGFALAVFLSLINAFVHSRDGYTAVVPTGMTLSGLVVVVFLLTALTDMVLANRSRVGG